MIHIEYILVISAVMLFAGIYGFLTRKSTFGHVVEHRTHAQCRRSQLCRLQPIALQRNSRRFVLFDLGIAIAAAESAVAIAIMINIYRLLNNISVDELKKMKW